MGYKIKGGKVIRDKRDEHDDTRVTPYITLPPIMHDDWREGMRHLTQAASRYQAAERFFYLPKSSAALHEAGHCVVALSEGLAVKNAKIWCEVHDYRQTWLGEFNRDDNGRDVDLANIEQVMMLCSAHLAGRISERLFAPADFNLVAGLDELVAASLLCFLCVFKNNERKDVTTVFEQTWSYLIRRVETILLSNESTVREIAKSLVTQTAVETSQLRQITSNVVCQPSGIDIPLNVEPILDPIERLAGFGRE